MATTRFADHLLTGTHASRPSASAVPAGTLYSCTTHNLIYQSDGSATWSTYATLSGTETLPASIIDAKGDLIAGTANDTAARLAVGTDGQVLTADAASTPGVKWAAAGSAGALTLLSTTTLGSAGPFDISSISGSYNDLIIVLLGRVANGAGGTEPSKWLLNNDTAANYNREMVQVNATTVTGQENAAAVGFNAGNIVGGASAAGFYTVTQMTLFAYASTVFKKTAMWETHVTTGTGTGQQTSNRGGGWWNSTAAITRVSVAGGTTTNLDTGSVFRIYGRL